MPVDVSDAHRTRLQPYQVLVSVMHAVQVHKPMQQAVVASCAILVSSLVTRVVASVARLAPSVYLQEQPLVRTALVVENRMQLQLVAPSANQDSSLKDLDNASSVLATKFPPNLEHVSVTCVRLVHKPTQHKAVASCAHLDFSPTTQGCANRANLVRTVPCQDQQNVDHVDVVVRPTKREQAADSAHLRFGLVTTASAKSAQRTKSQRDQALVFVTLVVSDVKPTPHKRVAICAILDFRRVMTDCANNVNRDHTAVCLVQLHVIVADVVGKPI